MVGKSASIDTKEDNMARADIETAVANLRRLHDMPFGGKRMGRLVLTRDQVADLLGVMVAHDKTIRLFSEAALNDEDLILAQAGRGVFAVVAARKARAWRKVPRAILSDLIGRTPAGDDSVAEDDEGED